MDVSESAGAVFTPDEFASLCTILFRNEEARAALLRSSEYRTGAKLDRREWQDLFGAA